MHILSVYPKPPPKEMSSQTKSPKSCAVFDRRKTAATIEKSGPECLLLKKQATVGAVGTRSTVHGYSFIPIYTIMIMRKIHKISVSFDGSKTHNRC